jgi:cation:H+ antiporter
MSPLLIGLTVVGFGTSTPELLVSLKAALAGMSDIALGNVVGSNIANILLIVGVTALVWPIRIVGATLWRDASVMLLAAVLLWPLVMMGELGRVAGAVLFVGLIAYLVLSIRFAAPEPQDEITTGMPVWHALLYVAVGLAALMLGARFLVDGAVLLARQFGVSEAFIGLTIVAVGTSLPELATSIVAAFRRQSEIALGNIVGSNIFNILGILGLTAVVTPVTAASRFASFDVPVMIAVSLVFALLLWFSRQIGRLPGVALLAGYAGYVYLAQM